MFQKIRWSILSAALILALLFSVFPLGAVMAEGEDPAPTDIPVTEEVSSVEEEALPPAEDAITVEELVAQVPEEVVVVPVDSAGDILTLAEEATASALVSGDPVYCPAWVTYLDLFNADCTDALLTIDDAIAEAAGLGSIEYSNSGSGTIYVAIDYTDLTPAPIVINGLSWPGAPNWLNLIGGVDFSTGEVTGKTVLNRPVEVSNLLSFGMENFIISGVEGTALSVSKTEYAYIKNSDLIENTGAGLSIIVNGPVNLEDVKADSNGEKNIVDAGYVNMYGVSSSGNASGPGMVANSTGDLIIESSKFNNNTGTGLSANAVGGLFVLCSQAINNTFIDPQDFENNAVGMDLTSVSNDIILLCNKMKSNSGYGLRTNAGGTIYMGGNIISGNGDDKLPNLVVEQYAPCSYLCPSCKGDGSSGEEEKPKEGNTQVVLVNVDDPNSSIEFKAGYATVFKLMEDQDGSKREVQRTILMSGSAPDGSTGLYTPLDESELPAPFGEGTTFMPFGFNLAITNPDGSPLEVLIGYMVIRFYLPEGFVLPGGMRLVIQYFDPATSSWTPMSTGVGGGMAYTYASKPGTYVLTMEPIK
jgi:hypothetical protein